MLIENIDLKFENDLPVVNYKERAIWFRGRISSRTAFVFETIVTKLNKMNHEPIQFFISGVGGDFFACRKIWGLISTSLSEFNVVAFDFVKSGCFFLTQSSCKLRLASEGTPIRFSFSCRLFCGI